VDFSLSSPAMWAALGNIILVNIVLSGDNAVVIALAARGLPQTHQRQAIIWGSVAAIIMRVILTVFAVQLLQYPYLKLIGGVLLLWIGVKLLIDDEDEETDIAGHTAMWAAVRTILVADLVMSLDNVIGVAAAAKGNVTLLIIGLAISIPLIVFGSSLMLKLMERYPIIITLGGALLGYLGGDMMATDPAIATWFAQTFPHNHLVIVPGSVEFTVTGLIGAVFVWGLGVLLNRRAAARRADATDAVPH
jgi:YjbE family integral membrane protein